MIVFNGYKSRHPEDPKSGEISLEEGAKNCVAGLKLLMKQAEQKKVTLCLEMLNTRAVDHPMKGHPGYQGDHIEYCLDIVKRVGFPNMKLLFDFYHVQIMDGDFVRHVQQCGEYIGHIHTAGNRGAASWMTTRKSIIRRSMPHSWKSGIKDMSVRNSSPRATRKPVCDRRYRFAMWPRLLIHFTLNEGVRL